MKNNFLSCEFNIDTACVEVKLTDGSMVSIDWKDRGRFLVLQSPYEKGMDVI